jgi:hypothetical protein
VHGGDKGQTPAADGDHLPGQQRAYRVRNGVVDVKQVKAVELGHFRHARGEGQIVGWKLEERIAGDRHLVIKDPLVAAGQAEGLRVRDEVDFVAQRSQFDAKFGGHYA